MSQHDPDRSADGEGDDRLYDLPPTPPHDSVRPTNSSKECGTDADRIRNYVLCEMRQTETQYENDEEMFGQDMTKEQWTERTDHEKQDNTHMKNITHEDQQETPRYTQAQKREVQ